MLTVAITFEVKLEPGEKWKANCNYILADNQHIRKPANLSYESAVDLTVVNTEIERLHCQWINRVTNIELSNDNVKRLYRQSAEDIGAFRLYDYDFSPDIWLPAAGVPKFVTLFGRDSLTISLQNMIVHPGLARDALKKLAQFQATEEYSVRRTAFSIEWGSIPPKLTIF
ncbi:hypothetical protein [Chroococcidiopsis sp. CCMEE 29]|uniref:hypothetical protein n=1 Tax=Chroococcidiopsis sp. CCMEE 29 TaxID=155894 RepID=UPI002020EC28|nr:hypothetical protein [Chroococcidiopsis sp. CCMEE 29]